MIFFLEGRTKSKTRNASSPNVGSIEYKERYMVCHINPTKFQHIIEKIWVILITNPPLPKGHDLYILYMIKYSICILNVMCLKFISLTFSECGKVS